MFIQTCDYCIVNIATGDVYKINKDNVIMLNGKTITSEKEPVKALAFWAFLVSKAANPVDLAQMADDTIE